MDKTCVNCKFSGIRLGVPQCNHAGHCLNYDYFEAKETIEVSRAKYEMQKDSIDSYAEFYSKMVLALGFPSDCLPCTELDEKMLKKVSELMAL